MALRHRAGSAHDAAARRSDTNEFGHMQFDTVRPAIAELLYRLKNRADREAAVPIIETAASFSSDQRDKFDAIVPVPPSHHRTVQPVIILADGIGKALSVPVLSCIRRPDRHRSSKNITEPEERKKHVEGLYEVDAEQTRGLKLLLFDDLFRSGTTMNAITDILLNSGKAAVVRASPSPRHGASNEHDFYWWLAARFSFAGEVKRRLRQCSYERSSGHCR